MNMNQSSTIGEHRIDGYIFNVGFVRYSILWQNEIFHVLNSAIFTVHFVQFHADFIEGIFHLPLILAIDVAVFWKYENKSKHEIIERTHGGTPVDPSRLQIRSQIIE